MTRGGLEIQAVEAPGCCNSTKHECCRFSAESGGLGANSTNGPGLSGVQPRKFGSLVGDGSLGRLGEPGPLALVNAVGPFAGVLPL